MFCSKCGAENPNNAKFCSKCGAEIAASVKTSKSTAKSEAEPAKAKAVATKPEAKASDTGTESSTGMSANVAGLLCYVAGWITGIVFVVLEKKSTFVKFHAWQSIMTFGVLTVAWLILSTLLGAIGAMTFSPGLIVFAGVMNVILWILQVGLWITLLIMAGTGRMWKVPWAGNWAEKQANK